MAFRYTYASPDDRSEAEEIALWRAKGEFWGMRSPFAIGAPVSDARRL
jgi:hypothetical protein